MMFKHIKRFMYWLRDNADANRTFCSMLFALGIVTFAAYCFKSCDAISPDKTVIEYRTDTVTTVKHDTLYIEKPVYKERYVTRHDTLYVNDTVYVEIPIETKVYTDSLYKAQVTGYNATLDYVEVYRNTEYKTVTLETTKTITQYRNRHWGIGVNVGYGAALYDGTVKLAPYIGLGVQYSIFSW